MRPSASVRHAAIGLLLLCGLSAASPAQSSLAKYTYPHEGDYSCRSGHRNPVLFLHGLTANFHSYNDFIHWIQDKGFCAYSLTYGAYPKFPILGGMRPLSDSSREVAQYVKTIIKKTGAKKVDLIGHSEGALQVLYTAKFGGIRPKLEHIIAISPPTHGITGYGIYFLIPKVLRGKGLKLLSKFCGACSDMIYDSPAVRKLNKGRVAQRGHKVTIIASHFDEGVTPPASASFINQTGVHNIYLQDYCPDDHAGHLGEAGDKNIYNIVLNSLENKVGRKFECGKGGGFI